MSQAWVAGKNAVLELFRASKREVFQVFMVGSHGDDAALLEIQKLASQKKIPIGKLNPSQMAKRSGVDSHQGVTALVSQFQYASLEQIIESGLKEKSGFLLLLDEIQDPHNVGALIRTAYLAGAKGLVLLKNRSAEVSATVAKVSSGACEYLPIAKVANLAQTIEKLKKNGFEVLGAAGVEGISLYQHEWQWPMALVLGSESKGLRRLVRESCDHLISIPMKGELDSFNVSVSGAIFMGELLRRSLNKG